MKTKTSNYGTTLVRTSGGVIAASVAALLVSGLPAAAQTGVTFSIDFQGPTGGLAGPFSGVPDSFTGARIDEGSILTAFAPGPLGPNPASAGPLPVPGMMTSAVLSGAGTVPGGLGIVPGPPRDAVEVDALSYGRDSGSQLAFSVDEWAQGIPGAPVFPNVTSEGAGGSHEASADIFIYLGPAIPTAPGPVIGNKGLIDGDGVGTFGGPGLGLIEPNNGNIVSPDRGDNLDAVDLDTTLNDLNGAIFFSMDAPFIDSLEPASGGNTGTAAANGFVGGDVVVTPGVGSGIIGTYAPAFTLGLDLSGPDTDDLDALILNDDGAIDPISGLPFYNPATDYLLFSVRRGSAVIGTLDSVLGIPIEEGDVLTAPLVTGTTPGIFIPAERIGLKTLRSSFLVSADLNALDLIVPEPASAALVGIGSLLVLTRRRTSPPDLNFNLLSFPPTAQGSSPGRRF